MSIFTPLKDLAFQMTPIIILMTLVGYLYTINISKELIFYILGFGLIGFIFEVIGVKTGFPFGHYHYGEGLSVQIFNVPLVLIVNWALLTTASLLSVSYSSKLVQYIVPPLLITLLDVLIEPVAIEFDWWKWDNGQIPISNFIGWLGVSCLINVLIMNTILKHITSSKNQSTSRYIILIQFIFFGLINLTI